MNLHPLKRRKHSKGAAGSRLFAASHFKGTKRDGRRFLYNESAGHPSTGSTKKDDITRKIFVIEERHTPMESNNPSLITKTLGRKIAAKRKEKKFSQARLAEAAKIDRSFISEIENGKVNVSIVVLEKIAVALNCTMGSLLDDAPGDIIKPS